MRRMISIVNLNTGRVSVRPGDTPTFDLPGDLDRHTGGAALDFQSQATYASTGGASVSRQVQARPLSWRVRGEQCMVAAGTRSATAAHPISYKLFEVAPNR